MINIFTVKNRWTNDRVSFEVSDVLEPRQKGLAVSEALEKAAYDLGCKVEDLIKI